MPMVLYPSEIATLVFSSALQWFTVGVSYVIYGEVSRRETAHHAIANVASLYIGVGLAAAFHFHPLWLLCLVHATSLLSEVALTLAAGRDA